MAALGPTSRESLSLAGVGTELLLIALLLLLNGALAMAEIAVVSARKARLRRRAEAGDAGAAAALQLAEEPTRFLSTVQVGITLVGILAGAFGGATIARPLGAALAGIPVLAPYAQAIALGLVVVAITYLSLIVGELVPKRLALADPERIAAAVARPMRVLSALVAPVVVVLSASTHAVLRLLQVRPSAEPAVTEEDVRSLLAEGARVGIVQRTEHEIVERVFAVGDQEVSELMTPRPLIAWLDVEDPLPAVWAQIEASPHSSYPVCRGELDEVLGVLSVGDLAVRLARGQQPDLRALVRLPLFLPEHVPAYRALEHFKTAGPRLALVVDEHGSVSGLLTPTDVLEAIVGELAPGEGEPPTGPVQRADGSWLLDGLMPVDDVVELFGLPEAAAEEVREVHTLGGLAMAQVGRVPAVGDRFDWHGLRFEVMDMDGRRVDKVLAVPVTAAAAG